MTESELELDAILEIASDALEEGRPREFIVELLKSYDLEPVDVVSTMIINPGPGQRPFTLSLRAKTGRRL